MPEPADRPAPPLRIRWSVALWTAAALAPLAAILVLLSPFIGDHISNSISLRRFETTLKGLSHPAGTERVRFESRVGLLVGNGNHCDFFVGDLRTYSGRKVDVERHYANAAIPNPVTGEQEMVNLLFVDKGSIPGAWLPDDLAQLAHWHLTPTETARPMYLVYVFVSYPANCDPRCH